MAALNPDVLATMTQLVTDMQIDLGLDGPSPRSRPLGRVARAQPLIHHAGTFTTQATALPFDAYCISSQPASLHALPRHAVEGPVSAALRSVQK